MINPNLKVLVVDNEPLVRLGIIVMLRECGWQCIGADGQKGAIQIVDQGFEPDLLITDQNMDDVTGILLGEDLAQRRPALKILLVSGDDIDEDAVPSGWRLLAKPFTSSELINKITELFASAAG
jgi:CheY-like chemotaxis protein